MIESLIALFLSGSAFAQEVSWGEDEGAHGFIVHYDVIEGGEDCTPQDAYRHQIDVGKTNVLDIGADEQFRINKRYKFQISSYFVYDGATFPSELSPEPVCLEKRLNLEAIEDVEITSASKPKKKIEDNQQPSKGDGKDEKQQQKSVTSISGFVRVDSSPQSRSADRANAASTAGRNDNPVESRQDWYPTNRVPSLLPPVFNSNGPRVNVGSDRAFEHAEVRKRDGEDLHSEPVGRGNTVQVERKLLPNANSVRSDRNSDVGVRSVAASLRSDSTAPEPASERNYNSIILALLGALALAGLYLGMRKKA